MFWVFLVFVVDTASRLLYDSFMAIKRIPSGFYDDHINRSLPAPPPVKETKNSVWIDTAHPDYSELLDDAKWYASLTSEGRDDPCGPFIRMARNMLKALA